MRNSDYQCAKSYLKEIATEAKKQLINDSPGIRQVINDTMDSICKDLQLSEYHRNLLANYACKLHPKK